MSNYVPLHVHSEFSLMDGVATTDEYAARAAQLGMPAIAITDHGTLSGHRQMYRSAKANGIKPILGIEAYVTADRFDKRDKKERTAPLDLIYNHLIILAKNKNGLANLNKMNEIAWTEGFYRKPRIDFEILEKYGDDLIVSSACPSGLINKAIEADDFAVAKSHIKFFKDRFGEDFFIELMPHNEPVMNIELHALAQEFGVSCIVTPDCHHCTKDQKTIQELMLILNTSPTAIKDATYEKSLEIEDAMGRLDYLYGGDRMLTFNSFDIHLLSYEEMSSAMEAHGVTDSLIYENTLSVADRIEDYDIPSNLNLLPHKSADPDAELKGLAYSGLLKRGLSERPEYVARLNEELSIVKDKNFSPYFLVVNNMVSWAKSNGILVGPGRGSAAGSLICYCLGITEVDPIKNGLLFFRFIDPSRNDFPDIDVDFQDNRREEVKAFLEREYENVASIITFQQFRGKGIVRDVSRAFRIPLADVNKVLKSVDSWEDFCASPNTVWFRKKYPEVEKYGEQIKGRIKTSGIHASGIVTASEPIFKYAPMEARTNPSNKEEKIPVVAVDMDEAASIGLIKIDALGLAALTIIDDTVKEVKARSNIDIDLNSIPLDDPKVYEMLSDGLTKGVFQCEATPYTNLLVKMRVRNFEELVASNALVRPGAMNTIGKEYLDRKRGKSITEYVHTVMKEDLQDTFGCILYQEQVMLACVKLGGMSMEEANKVRKIIGKKKDAAEFDQFKDKFITNASVFISPQQAEDLWHDFEAHAGYSFNKSHAVAYSMLSYWTAWLKANYPLEFIYAILKNESDKDSRTEYLIEAKRLGIRIKLPHVNESKKDFSIEGNAIRFGLNSIKFISDKVAEKIIAARPFTSYKHLKETAFTKGSGINSTAVKAMDLIGAATFPDNPRDMDKVKENLYEYLNLPEFSATVPNHFYAYVDDSEEYDEQAAHILIAMAKKIKRGKGWSRVEFMDRTGMVGIFDDEDTTIETGKMYIVLVGSNRIAKAVPVDNLKENRNDPLVKFLNFKTLPYGQGEHYVLSFTPRVTKAGKRMAHMVVADADRNLIPVLVFPTMFSRALMNCEEGSSVNITLSKTKDGAISLSEIN